MNKIVLFVCRGNRYRSRIAEEIFNKNAPEGYVAKSAGMRYQRYNDRAVPKVLREIGIELTKKKPMKLTNKMLKRASGVVVFDGVSVSRKSEVWPIKDCHAGDIVCIRKGRKLIEKRMKKFLQNARFAKK